MAVMMKFWHAAIMAVALVLPAAAQELRPGVAQNANEGWGISVVDHGIDNSGTNDVVPGIQALVPGGTAPTHLLYFPAGTYTFLGNVLIVSGKLVIQCEPGKTTFIASASHSATAALFFWVETGSTLEIRGCIFDGNMLNVGRDLPYIIGTGSLDDIFEFNTFTNNRSNIIAETASTRPKVRFNRFTNVGWWFANGGANTAPVINTFNSGVIDPVVVGNNVDTVGGDFLDSGATNLLFSENKIIGNNQGWISPSTNGGNAGVYVAFGSVGATITGNYFYGLTGNGIDLHCAHDVVATGNTSTHNSGAGVAISGAPAGDVSCNAGGTADSISNVTVVGNTLLDNGQSALGRTTIATNSTTAAGNAVLHFASTAGVVDGTLITATNVPVNTFISSHNATSVTMTRNATGAGVANGASILFGWSNPGTEIQSAIWIGCSNSPAVACTADHLTINGNTATDDQSTKTQRYAVAVDTADTVTFSNSDVCSGAYAGNLTGMTNSAALECTVTGTIITNSLYIGPDTGSAEITVDNVDGANNSRIVLSRANNSKWLVSNNSGDTFSVFDVINNKSALGVTTGGVATLGETGSAGNSLTGTWNLGTAASDATHTDATVCRDTTSGLLMTGSGAVGICLGTSSLRFKRDVGPLREGLGTIMALKPIHYRYKKQRGLASERELFGFAAEQVAEVAPKLVGFDAGGRPNSVDWAGVVPILVRAIQDQQHEIEKMKAAR